MQHSKKIVLVANSTWNIYNFRLNLIKKLITEGHRLTIIAPIDEYLEYRESFPEVKHIPLKTMGRDSTNPIRDLLLLIELYRKYRWLKPDLVIHYTNKPNIYGGIAAGLLNISSVAVVTGLGYSFIHKGVLNKIVKHLYKISGKFHRRFIFENEDDKSLFLRQHVVKKENAFAVKGCGVDSTYYSVPANNDHNKEQITFTFIGRLLYDKGIIEFVAAAKNIKKKYSNVNFEVIGEFDEENPSSIDKDYLNKWVDNGIIEYKGFVKDIRPFISYSDCVVLPSYREGMPRTLLEGMSMAKPIITTDVPGCKETVIEGQNGFLVPPRDEHALSDSFERLIQMNENERIQFGANGRKMVEEIFEQKIIADQIYQILTPLLDESTT